jgi:hypothetical protein
MCSVIRKIHQHPLPNFQILSLSEKAAIMSERILMVLYPQGYFMSNVPEVLSAVERRKKIPLEMTKAYCIWFPNLME